MLLKALRSCKAGEAQQLTCPRCTAWQPLSLLGSLDLGLRAATAQECNISNLSYLLESFELAFASALHDSGSRSCGSQRINAMSALKVLHSLLSWQREQTRGRGLPEWR